MVRSKRRAWSRVFAKREMLAMCVDQDSFLLKVTPRMRKSSAKRFVKGQHSEGRQLCGLKLMFIILIFSEVVTFVVVIDNAVRFLL